MFITKVKLETRLKVKTLRSDGGGEYTVAHVQQYLEERSITHEITIANTPQYNGVAECLNCTLLDKTWAMLSEANLPESY